MKTETLIGVLAADAARPVTGIRPLLRSALVAGGAGSLALFAMLLGPRANLGTTFLDADFLVKIGFTGCLTFTATLALDTAARPTRRAPALRMLVLGPLLLACAVIVELLASPSSGWLVSLVGRNAGRCLGAIPVLSALPALFLMMALKRGAPARPRLAAAIAGLAAGGIGASLYAVFCPIDDPLFVAAWYSLAIGAVTAVCALCGRWLRW